MSQSNRGEQGWMYVSFSEVFSHGEKESCPRAVELFLYFQNRLSGQDRTAFEEHLPMCSACTQQLLDLRETERMADATELEPSQAELIFERSRARLQSYLDVKYGKPEPARTGFANLLAKFFRPISLPAYANAAVIVLLLILLYPAYKSFVLEERLTQVEKELAAEQATGHARIAALEAERKDYQQQAHRLNEERRALLAPNLSSSAIQTVRSERGGRAQTIDVKFSPQEKSFNLLLSVEGLDFDTYVVEILQDKTVLWREEIRPARAGTSPFALLSVTLHRDYFQAGTYRLAVYGQAAKRTVRLAEYQLRIST